VQSQPTFSFGRNRHVPIYSDRKTLVHLGKKNIIHRYWSKKMTVDVGQERWPIEVKKEASPHDPDRTFPYRHHAYFIKGLNRKLNSRHRSWSSPDWYFSADIAQFFLKNARWRIMFFFMAEEVFLFWCCIKNVGRLGFFVRFQPTFCFGRNRHVPIYSARKTLVELGKKNIIHRYWSKKMTVDFGQERWPIEV